MVSLSTRGILYSGFSTYSSISLRIDSSVTVSPEAICCSIIALCILVFVSANGLLQPSHRLFRSTTTDSSHYCALSRTAPPTSQISRQTNPCVWAFPLGRNPPPPLPPAAVARRWLYLHLRFTGSISLHS